MSNFNTFLSFNTYTPQPIELFNPRNVLKLAYNLIYKENTTVKKQNILGLNQAEDKYIDFKYTINGQEITDVATATFVVYGLDYVERFRYSLADNVSFKDSVFTVLLSDAQTQDMAGKYLYELWMKDSAGLDTLMFKGAMKFKPTVGRRV